MWLGNPIPGFQIEIGVIKVGLIEKLENDLTNTTDLYEKLEKEKSNSMRYLPFSFIFHGNILTTTQRIFILWEMQKVI